MAQRFSLRLHLSAHPSVPPHGSPPALGSTLHLPTGGNETLTEMNEDIIKSGDEGGQNKERERKSPFSALLKSWGGGLSEGWRLDWEGRKDSSVCSVLDVYICVHVCWSASSPLCENVSPASWLADAPVGIYRFWSGQRCVVWPPGLRPRTPAAMKRLHLAQSSAPSRLFLSFLLAVAAERVCQHLSACCEGYRA